jgi:hypothetical protein
VVATGDDKAARLWDLPLPIVGDPHRVLLWAQILTNAKLDLVGDAIRPMDSGTWIEMRRNLESLDSLDGDTPANKRNPFLAGTVKDWD